jgi:class 3 adenylate cyclase
MIATAPAGTWAGTGGYIVDPLSVKRRLTCILAADAVGYSQHMGRDEEGTIRVLAAHRSVIDGIIIFHGGRIISTAGDSVLAEFASVVEAVRSAVEVQEALKTRNDTLPEESRMHFRVGVNLGDVVVKDNDLLGDGVNVAARLETIAEPGGICISSSVYDQITGKLDLGFKDIGEQSLKNISRPIRVYRVSGTAVPQPASFSQRRQGRRKSIPWGIIGTVVVAIAAIGAWQSGWLRFGAADRGSPTNATAPVTAPIPTAPSSGTTPPSGAAPPQIDADTQRLRADAEALRKQAESELLRARSDAEASRAARSKVDAEAVANRLRAQAEADAARIRGDAEAVAARTKSDAESATRDAATKIAKAAPALTPAPTPASAAGGDGHYDGAWNVTVICAKSSDGAFGYTYAFDAVVKNNVLRGERNAEGKPGWLLLQGAIQPDGNATLDAQGITDDPKYTSNNVAQGTRFGYHVAAHFDSNRGTGRRLELRPCDLRFAKQ